MTIKFIVPTKVAGRWIGRLVIKECNVSAENQPPLRGQQIEKVQLRMRMDCEAPSPTSGRLLAELTPEKSLQGQQLEKSWPRCSKAEPRLSAPRASLKKLLPRQPIRPIHWSHGKGLFLYCWQTRVASVQLCFVGKRSAREMGRLRERRGYPPCIPHFDDFKE